MSAGRSKAFRPCRDRAPCHTRITSRRCIWSTLWPPIQATRPHRMPRLSCICGACVTTCGHQRRGCGQVSGLSCAYGRGRMSPRNMRNLIVPSWTIRPYNWRSRRCASELTQDEHAVLFGAARAIFLRHEIHSIFKRGNEGDVARPIMRKKIVAIETPKMVLHRQPGVGGETAVNIANEPVNTIFELVISWNLHPARDDDLDQHHAAAQFGITVQSGAKCAQSFGYCLAVVEPVRTEDQLTIRKCGPQLLRSLCYRVRPCSIFE